MCGVAGFFVGCELASECAFGTQACALVRDRSALHDWHTKASVRRAPRRVLNEDDLKSHVFPHTLAPVVSHDLVRRRGAETSLSILTNHLYRYLDFTYKLELVVVNDVTKDIALSQSIFVPAPEIRLDAMKIYCDEGYHALFSYDLMNQLYELTGNKPILPEAPLFLKKLQDTLYISEGEHERRLIKLFFVIVSETLITSSLLQIKRDREMPEPLRQLIGDHANDEARHHIFFADLLKAIWPIMTKEMRMKAIVSIPSFIMAFIAPDEEAIADEIVAAGLSRSDAEIVIKDTYQLETVRKYALGSSTMLRKYVKELPEFWTMQAQEAFAKHGLL